MFLKKFLLSLSCSAVVSLSIISALPAFAIEDTVDTSGDKNSFDDGVLTYTYVDGGVSVTHCESTATKVSISDTVSGYSVIAIGESAFEGCSGLSQISIPSSVKTVGNYAFKDCTALTSATLS